MDYLKSDKFRYFFHQSIYTVDSIRIDKWLWAVRLFKTRTIAGDACKMGKVRINGQRIKPAREIKVGEEISVTQGAFQKTVRVVKVIKNRVGAPLAVECYNDLTPQEEYDKLEVVRRMNSEFRPKGEGRPTKRNRRMIDILKNQDEDGYE